MTAPYVERNRARAREAAARDYMIANEILTDPDRPPMRQDWLDVVTERAGDKFASWPEIAARMGLGFNCCYGRWRRLMETTGRRPVPRRPPRAVPWLPEPEPRAEPEWWAEYRDFVASEGYTPSRGTARLPDEVAS